MWPQGPAHCAAPTHHTHLHTHLNHNLESKGGKREGNKEWIAQMAEENCMPSGCCTGLLTEVDTALIIWTYNDLTNQVVYTYIMYVGGRVHL